MSKNTLHSSVNCYSCGDTLALLVNVDGLVCLNTKCPRIGLLQVGSVWLDELLNCSSPEFLKSLKN